MSAPDTVAERCAGACLGAVAEVLDAIVELGIGTNNNGTFLTWPHAHHAPHTSRPGSMVGIDDQELQRLRAEVIQTAT